MKVYHFLNAEYGLKDLREQRLKLSTISGLNDPFEFLPISLSEPGIRKQVNKAKKIMNDHLGLICFSRSWENPVQWSHYAERHRGICLGFEVPDHKLKRIKYVKNRLEITESIKNIETLLTYKFSDWAYENEVRLFEKITMNETGICYKNFGQDLKLVEIIVGSQSLISKSTIRDILNKYIDEVEYFKARAGFKKFEVVRNMNVNLWN